MTFEWPVPGGTLRAPGGAIVGLLSEDRETVRPLLESARDAGVLTFDQTRLSLGERWNAIAQIEASRRAGTPVIIASWDEFWLGLCDELWWLEGGAEPVKGHPSEVLPLIHADASSRFAHEHRQIRLPPLFRRGDGRAQLVAITSVDASGFPVSVWKAGEEAGVNVTVRYEADVEDPVVGMMIRTRSGMEVYGTNTQLENLRLGPVTPQTEKTIRFRFECRLCPQMYTVTAASHDPDGVWHDWIEDAVAIMVSGSRYTAGVADLAARVTVEDAGFKQP